MRYTATTFGAPVPKASVNKDRQALSHKPEIWATGDTGSVPLPTAETVPNQVRRDAHLS